MWSRTPLLPGCCRRAETAGLYGTAHGTTLAVGFGAMRDSLFSLVSFEGTDPYSQAGGLGVRVSGLARTLAELRYETHLFFIGDPHRPGEERTMDGYLTLHRWAQWISINCPGGVYDGEDAKVRDLTQSLPQYLLDRVVRPAIAANKMPVVLFE